LCSRWLFGTRTFSNRILACHVPRIPHLDRFFWKMSTPSMSGVHTSAVTFSFPSPSFCLAITVNRLDSAPLVAHFFSPLMM